MTMMVCPSIHLVASIIPALQIAVLIILKTSSLVHLNARSTGLNEQVLLIVGRALRLGSNLVTLHLENCGVYERCLVILVAALKLNTTLRELFLAENKISPADGFQLGNLLRTNTHLELLGLSNNKLGNTIEIAPAAKSKSFSIDKERTTDPLIHKSIRKCRRCCCSSGSVTRIGKTCIYICSFS